MKILGISAFYHDSAAALVVDGHVVAAAEEERFSRKKHDSGFPRRAVRFCLEAGGIGLGQIDHVVFYDKPFLKFERLLKTYLAYAPAGFASFRTAMPTWLKEKLFFNTLLGRELRSISPGFDVEKRLLFTEHHQSHAASAFFPSPFADAAVLTIDGVGEWISTSLAHGQGHRLTPLKQISFPHSLGLLYSAFTYFLGFEVNDGEYKVMGLAPYGEPVFVETILGALVDLKPDGTFRLDQRYFNYCSGLTMTNARFSDLFNLPPRVAGAPLNRVHLDLAASIQKVIELAVLGLARTARRETGSANLCLAGGVSLNCVANGKIVKEGIFEKVWVQPAAGDAGGAIGAALSAYHMHNGRPRVVAADRDGMSGAYLGPSYNQDDIERMLAEAGADFVVLGDNALVERAAHELSEGRVVGWFQGAMEFGPRALGNRSILGDPRSPEMQSLINRKVKFRESFRPFAPAVLAEEASEWFEFGAPSPYMLMVAPVAASRRLPVAAEDKALRGLDRLSVSRSVVPAITHVDYSARLQTVTADSNPRFHALLSEFKRLTGCPVLVNTSFNVSDEPIVCSPTDAYRCFLNCDIDTLVVGNCVMRKEDQGYYSCLPIDALNARSIIAENPFCPQG